MAESKLTSVPQTRYALNGDVHLAYQVFGHGPPDVLMVLAGPASHVEHVWDNPAIARTLRRYASYSRFIIYDERGVGLSDPVTPGQAPTIDEQVDDIRAILDETGCARAVLLGYVAGSAPAMVFAATHPERVESLVLFAPYARLVVDDEYPIGVPQEVVEQAIQLTLSSWGTGAYLPLLAPSMAGDEPFRTWWGQMERLGSSPRTAAALVRQWFDVDVRSVLPTIRVPTLVIARKDQPLIGAVHARYVADHIKDARYVEVQGSDLHFFVGDMEPVFAAYEDFLGTGHPRVEPDEILGSVLFTDIVESTATMARIGDLRWRDLLESHNRLAARLLERFRGRLIETTGDGIMAVFDAPTQGIACAQAFREAVRGLGVQIRAGLHTGMVERHEDGMIGGIAVHTAARICALAAAGEIYVSRTIRDLVAGSSIRLESRGVHELKGVPGPWEVFAVLS